MKPYYSADGIVIYHGDCRDILPSIERVDLVLTDPPYGMDWNTNSKRFSGGQSLSINRKPRGEGRSDYGAVKGDDKPFEPEIWLGFPKVILWGSNHYSQRLQVGTTLVWLKRHPELHGSFLSDAEIGWMKGGCGVYCHYKQFPPPVRAVEAGGDPCNPLGTHPTQKPISLMAWCIELSNVFAKETILDPYCGSGSTLVAAKLLGRHAIGIELEERYCEISARRLAQGVLPLGFNGERKMIQETLL